MTFTRSPSITLFLLSLLGMSYCRAILETTSDVKEKGCEATFTEGQTAELTFLIAHEALAHHDFFAHLRRSDDTDIVICDRNSPVKCNALDLRYKTNGIVNGRLVLQIPNITRDFQDTYVFQGYATSKPEPRYECHLKVKGSTWVEKCSASKVTAGNIGEVRFMIGDGLLSHSDFLIRLRRASDPASDIIVCNRNTSVKCDILNQRYTSDGITANSLTLWIPNISPDFEDIYILQVFVGGSTQFPVACHLTVTEDSTHTAEINGWSNITWISITAVVIVLLFVAVPCAFVGPKLKKSCKQRSEQSTGKTGDGVPLLSNQTNSNDESRLKGNKWYYGQISRETEKLLLKCRQNGPGSFLIRKRITNPDHFTLSVLFEGDIHRFTIVPEQNGYKCIETEKCFSTLPHLVDFYKKHDIEVHDKVWGKLSKPFQEELEAEWYFGHITDKDETKLLKSGQEEKTGTFLVKDGTHGLHDYVLSVNHKGIVLHFPIVQRDNVFNVLDTGGSFQTVPDLVGHYKEHDIQTGKGVFKLGKPADKAPEEEWYHEILTTDEQIKLLQSNRKQPGYFLIAPGNTNPNDYILTVYSLGQMRRFAIRAERCGFMFLDTDMFFHSLHELVDYYSTRDIKEGNRVWGKLTKPFRKEPSEKWYFGKFDREEEKKLLSVEGNGAGAFLIRVGLSDPDDYTLAVNVDGNLNHFKILSEENGFKVRDCTDCFHTLEELVDHYSDNEITVGKKSYGKLKTPFKRKEKESSTQTNAAAILNSPAGQRPELDIYA